MARKNIPLRDRAIIKSRLARGFSYSKALEGTSVKSKNTVMLIAREEKDDIGRLRKEYLAMVSSFGGDTETQARQLAKQVTATYRKMLGKEVIVEEDWDAQLKAIQYLHKLRGIAPKAQDSVTVNILNPEFIRQYDERYK